MALILRGSTGLALRNNKGEIDLAMIDPDAVAALTDTAQEKFAVLISTVTAHVAAQERYTAAVQGLRAAQEEQAAALEAHRAASDPFPFVPPSQENYATQAAYDAALREARERHDLRVRAHREAEERRRSIAAFNSSL